MNNKGLSEILAQYPPDHPQSLAALVDADPSEITDQLAWALRHQAVDVSRRWEQHYVTSPWAVMDLIVSGYVVHPYEKCWRSYALSPERQPILVPSDKGGSRYLSRMTRILPKAEDLPPLPHRSRGNSAWLVVYGGSPDVLDKPGVVPGLTRLAREVSIADVVFYDKMEDLPTLWSVKAATGMSGTTRASAREVPFPNPQHAAEIGGVL